MTGVYLTDFGLAKNVATGSRFTRTGTTLGTPAYMSPELARGDVNALTPASDTWALGAVLYELLASRPAFEGDNTAAVIARVLTADPADLRRAAPQAPRHLCSLVAACLSRPARWRPATAAALRDDVERVLQGQQPLARPPRRWRRIWAAALVLLTLGAARSAYVLTRDDGSAASAPATVDDRGGALAASAWELRHTDLGQAAALLGQALERDPENHAWRLRHGLLCWIDGRPEQAQADWAAIPAGTPVTAEARLLAGIELIERSEQLRDKLMLARAYDILTQAADDTTEAARLARAMLLLRDVGLAAARAELGDTTGWQAALVRLQLIWSDNMLTGAVNDAERQVACTTLIDAGIPFPSAYIGRASARRRAGRLADARADLDIALRRFPESPELHMANATLLQAEGDAAGALREAGEAIRLRADNPNGWLARADVHLAEGHPELALPDLAQALKLLPGDRRTLRARGRAYFALGRLPEALADFGDVLRAGPDDPAALTGRGRVHLIAERLELADADFARALELRPDQHLARGGRGVVRMLRGDLAAAARDLDAAVEGEPGSGWLRTNRALLRWRRGDGPGAIADLDVRHGLGRPEAETLWLRAIFKDNTDDTPGAIADFRAALAIDANSVEAHGAFGMTLARLERWAEARVHLQRALELDPAHKHAAQLRSTLAGVLRRLGE